MSDAQWELRHDLEDIHLQMKNGIDTLLIVAETLDRADGRPEGPACYFIADGLTRQRHKLMECLDAMTAAAKDDKPRSGPTLVS